MAILRYRHNHFLSSAGVRCDDNLVVAGQHRVCAGRDPRAFGLSVFRLRIFSIDQASSVTYPQCTHSTTPSPNTADNTHTHSASSHRPANRTRYSTDYSPLSETGGTAPPATVWSCSTAAGTNASPCARRAPNRAHASTSKREVSW
jgi:hypothetical protein